MMSQAKLVRLLAPPPSPKIAKLLQRSRPIKVPSPRHYPGRAECREFPKAPSFGEGARARFKSARESPAKTGRDRGPTSPPSAPGPVAERLSRRAINVLFIPGASIIARKRGSSRDRAARAWWPKAAPSFSRGRQTTRR